MARLLKATSSFGADLDSLSDFFSFVVAPAAVLYLWTMSEWHVLGWVIVLFFAVCCALRLARFNAGTNAEVPSYAAPFFSGAPAPAGAGLFFFQAEDGIRCADVTGVQTCALPICHHYAIRAGRNLPDKEFRYLRTVIVTAAVYRGFDQELRPRANTIT